MKMNSFEQEVCLREPISCVPQDRVDLNFSDWFSTDVLAENVCTIVNHVTITTPTALSVNSTDGKSPSAFIYQHWAHTARRGPNYQAATWPARPNAGQTRAKRGPQ